MDKTYVENVQQNINVESAKTDRYAEGGKDEWYEKSDKEVQYEASWKEATALFTCHIHGPVHSDLNSNVSSCSTRYQDSLGRSFAASP